MICDYSAHPGWISHRSKQILSHYWLSDVSRLRGAILKQYHQRLQALGTTDYSWDELWCDYQLCVVMGIYNAIEFCKNGVDEAVRGWWQSLLRRSIMALEDFSSGHH